MATKAERLRARAAAIEAAERLAERLATADTIPTCPKCGGRSFKVYTHTVVSQSIEFTDDADGDWWDDYESGDHTDLNDTAHCNDCSEDVQEVLERFGWVFYDDPQPRVPDGRLAVTQWACKRLREVRAELKRVGARAAQKYVQRALKSVEGAVRHAGGLATRPHKCGDCYSDTDHTYVCTLDQGHAGDHVMTTNPMHPTWPSTVASSSAPPDTAHAPADPPAHP